jgi:hypothetical protein
VTGGRGFGWLLPGTSLSDGSSVGAIGELRAAHAVVVVDGTVVASAVAWGNPEHVGGRARAGRHRADAVLRKNVGDPWGAGMLVDGFRVDPGATPAGRRVHAEGLVGGATAQDCLTSRDRSR